MLYDGYRIYYKSGDQESADICAKYILKIPVDIKRVLDETDALAYKINDIPELELPNRYMRIIDKVQKSQN